MFSFLLARRPANLLALKEPYWQLYVQAVQLCGARRKGTRMQMKTCCNMFCCTALS